MILDWWRFIEVQPWPKGALKLPRLQSHRGYWMKGIQENTLQALQAAKAHGAQMSEFDVQLSRDLKPVIFHDTDLVRLGQGNPQKVSDLTAQELFEAVGAPSLEDLFRCASEKMSGTFNSEKSDNAVNTVNAENSAPLQIANKNSYRWNELPYLFNIELKTDSIAGTPLERKVSQLIVKYQMQSRVLVSSFNPFSLHRMSLFLPQVPRALLVTNEDNPKNNLALKELWLTPFLSFHMINFDQRMIDEDMAKRLKKYYIPFAVWTVNQKESANDYFRWGAQSIISDTLFPDWDFGNSVK